MVHWTDLSWEEKKRQAALHGDCGCVLCDHVNLNREQFDATSPTDRIVELIGDYWEGGKYLDLRKVRQDVDAILRGTPRTPASPQSVPPR